MLCARVRASLRFARILERLVLRDPGLWLCLWGCDGGLTGVSMSFLFYVSGLNPGRLSCCIGLIPDLGRNQSLNRHSDISYNSAKRKHVGA